MNNNAINSYIDPTTLEPFNLVTSRSSGSVTYSLVEEDKKNAYIHLHVGSGYVCLA